MVKRDDLVGTWRLESYEVRAEGGEVSHPFGKDTRGYLLYAADGYVSATLMRPDRPKFAAGDLLGGTVEEKTKAAEGYIAYCGTYRLEGDRVAHHVELSLFPNWIGADQVRLVALEGDRLELSTPPFLLGGARRTAHLIWRRV